MNRSDASGLPRHRAWWIVCITWVLGSLLAMVIVMASLHVEKTASPWLWIWCASAWAALSLMWILLRRGSGDDRRWRGLMIGVILLGAGAARIAVVMTHEPTLSDDVYRYVFDGRNMAAGVNPYLIRPQDRASAGGLDAATPFVPMLPPGLLKALKIEEDWPGQADIARAVNNQELYTIYLPVSQYVFGGAGLLVTDANSDVASSTRVFRFVFISFDMAAIAMLLAWLVNHGRSVWWAALYAWHPLPIVEFAGSGHQDVIGLPLMLLAMMMYSRMPKRYWPWSILLALATLVKPVAAPLGAFLLKGRPWHAWLGSAAIGAAVIAALSAPLLLADDGRPIDNLRDTSSRFTAKWAHFGSVYEPVRAGLDAIDPVDVDEPWIKQDEHIRTARIVCMALLVLATIAIFCTRLDAWSAASAVLLAMVLLTPAAHPWYLLWALLLTPMAKNGVVWAASLTLPLGYLVDWSVSPGVMIAAYAPVYGWLVVSVVRHFTQRAGETKPTKA